MTKTPKKTITEEKAQYEDDKVEIIKDELNSDVVPSQPVSKPLILFAYVRVSTDTQVKDDTPELQRIAIRRYAERSGAQVKQWFEDPGMSGTSRERPQFNEMLDRIDEVDGIVVFDISRLVREEELSEDTMRKMKHKNKKLYVAISGRAFDFDDSMDRLFYKLYAWFADEERTKIRSRLEAGMEKYIAEGGKVGRKKKPIDWRKYDQLKAAKVSHKSIAMLLKVTPKTLYRRLNDRKGENRPREEPVVDAPEVNPDD